MLIWIITSWRLIMSTHEDFEDCPLQNIIRDGGMMNIFRTIGCIGDSLASGEFEYWVKKATGTFMNTPGVSKLSALLVFQ